MTYLGGTLKVLDAVTVNVVVRSDGLSKLGTNDHTRSISGRTTREKHYPGTSVGEGSLSSISLAFVASTAKTHLKQRDSHAQSHTCTPQRPLILIHGPRVPLELLQDVGELEFTSLDRHKELGGSRGGHRLTRAHGLNGAVGGVEAEHVGDLLGLVILGTSENVGLGAVGVGEFVDHGL